MKAYHKFYANHWKYLSIIGVPYILWDTNIMMYNILKWVCTLYPKVKMDIHPHNLYYYNLIYFNIYKYAENQSDVSMSMDKCRYYNIPL